MVIWNNLCEYVSEDKHMIFIWNVRGSSKNINRDVACLTCLITRAVHESEVRYSDLIMSISYHHKVENQNKYNKRRNIIVLYRNAKAHAAAQNHDKISKRRWRPFGTGLSSWSNNKNSRRKQILKQHCDWTWAPTLF